MTQNTVQSSYGRYLSAGVAGEIADGTPSFSDSRICETSAGIGFGLAVSQGTGDNGAILGGGLFVGISVRDITLVNSVGDEIQQYDNMGVLINGDIWVQTKTVCVPRQKVYYNSSTGQIGKSTISNAVEIVGATFLDTGAADDIVRIRLTGAGDLTA